MHREYNAVVDKDMPYLRFKRILDCFNKNIKECILMRSEAFKMPYNLGTICVVKYLPKTYTDKSLHKDYKSSKEEGKTIYHLNEHSGGYSYRLFWSKSGSKFPDMYKYQLSFTRENKRKLAKLIFEHNDYININDIQIYKM